MRKLSYFAHRDHVSQACPFSIRDHATPKDEDETEQHGSDYRKRDKSHLRPYVNPNFRDVRTECSKPTIQHERATASEMNEAQEWLNRHGGMKGAAE
jgi:hypothetical protein